MASALWASVIQGCLLLTMFRHQLHQNHRCRWAASSGPGTWLWNLLAGKGSRWCFVAAAVVRAERPGTVQLQSVRPAKTSVHFTSCLHLKVHAQWAAVRILLPCSLLSGPAGLPALVPAGERAAFSYMRPLQWQEGRGAPATSREALLQAGECAGRTRNRLASEAQSALFGFFFFLPDTLRSAETLYPFFP